MGIKFQVKKFFVKRNMKNKIKNKPMDIVKDEMYQLPPEAGIMQNNSYFFGGFDAKERQALVMRLGIRNCDYRELFVLYKTKDGLLVNGKDYYDLDDVPLKVQCIVPGKEWKVDFDGILYEQDTNKPRQVKFSYTWKAVRDAFDFFYTEQSPYMVDASARCKWNDQFKNSVGKNEQRHYEQPGHMTGEIVIDGEKAVIDMPSGRDHSYGYRDWDDMSEHIWLFACTEKGEVFNYSLVDYKVLKNCQFGICDIGKDKLYSIKKNEIVHYDYNDGLGGDNFQTKMTLTDGTVLNVKLNRVGNQKTEYQQGDYYFQEGFAEFDINGVKAFGSLEYGFNKDKSRWEYDREVK